jgi:adenylosuccinate synthase
MISGITELAVTKLDVLNGLNTLKICTKYRVNDREIDFFPAKIEDVENCQPIYEEFKGWNVINKDSRKLRDLPEQAQEYLRFIEKELKIPIKLVSIGPGREDTIEI